MPSTNSSFERRFQEQVGIIIPFGKTISAYNGDIVPNQSRSSDICGSYFLISPINPTPIYGLNVTLVHRVWCLQEAHDEIPSNYILLNSLYVSTE